MSVRRAVPYDMTATLNYDERTLYVEKLPVKADHDSLRELFGHLGRVAYVSLPRHEASGVVKGFCFVEFADKASADRALAEILALQAAEADARAAGPTEQKRLRLWRRMRVMTKYGAVECPPYWRRDRGAHARSP